MADEGEMEHHDMRPPESAARPEPSWPTVIETTLRLWLERHPVVVAGKSFRIQLPVLPRNDSRARRRAGMPSRKRLATIVLAVGVLVAGAGAAGLAMTRQRAPAHWSAVVPVPAPVGQIAAIAPAQDSMVAVPVALTIPAIGVQTSLVHLGLTASGALQVPSSTAVAGWYTGSSRPGAIGPAVIAGHIDSYTGPGIFFRLSELRPGDRVYVRRADGTIALFRVTAVRSYAKDSFPTQAVYGPTPDAELRLITCGGTFDPELRSYLSNTVVYAAQLS